MHLGNMTAYVTSWKAVKEFVVYSHKPRIDSASLLDYSRSQEVGSLALEHCTYIHHEIFIL